MSDSANITMKDITRDLGVSVATVSRTFKDSPHISAEKRGVMKEYAQGHNFYPDILAENLRKGKVQPIRVIGVIIPQLNHFCFSSILSGTEEEASSCGYRIMIVQNRENYENEVKICRAFLESKVCGIIVSQAKNTTEYDHFQTLIDKSMPLVLHDRTSTGVNASRVVVDDYMGAFSVVTHFINTGCRRIAYHGTSLTMQVAKNRYNGYLDALLKNGMHPNKQLIKNCDNRSDAELITPGVMRLPEPPDTFSAVNDDTAIGILYSCKRLGFHVPEDVSVCGFTNG